MYAKYQESCCNVSYNGVCHFCRKNSYNYNDISLMAMQVHLKYDLIKS